MLLDTLTFGFIKTIRACWIASTRDPASERWLFWRFIDDLLASAMAIAPLAPEGIDLRSGAEPVHARTRHSQPLGRHRLRLA